MKATTYIVVEAKSVNMVKVRMVTLGCDLLFDLHIKYPS